MKTKKAGGMGFRDLHAFNLAILAGQAWRLIHNPTYLCARYYPNGSILQARPKVGISYTWRSILKGVNLLKKGIIWRVGSGNNIDIWSDPWILRGTTRRVVTQRGKNIITNVKDLLDPSTNNWDGELVRQPFLPEDAEIILQIPIHKHKDYFIAWHYDKKVYFQLNLHIELL